MGKQFSELSQKHIEFIKQQHLYFVGTAAETGTVNISPKGGDTLRVINPTRVIWQNLTGSGNETAAHLLKNPRMTLMFCSFEGAPLILRLYGTAQVIHKSDTDWQQCIDLFPDNVASRQVLVLDIDLVQASCGMSVPKFDFLSDRDELDKWSQRKGVEGIEAYWESRNQYSIDGFETGIVKNKVR